MNIANIIVMAFISFSALGQSPANLDKKKGFREDTIGSNLSSFKGKLQFIKKLESNESKLFRVKELVTVNGMSGEVELAFYKDTLVEVTVFFNKKTIDDYDDLKLGLTRLFGSPEEEESNGPDLSYIPTDHTISSTWKGSVIGLQYNYNISHKVIEMVYWGLNETSEIAMEGF